VGGGLWWSVEFDFGVAIGQWDGRVGVVARFPQHSICSRLRSNLAGFEYCAFLRPAFVGVVKAVELLPQQFYG